ncbi:MAG: hypothetical protein QXR73_00330 [Candidatus Micrarchaeaceae archaeon]
MMNLAKNKAPAEFGLYLMCAVYAVVVPAASILLFGSYGYPVAMLSSAMFFAYYIAKLKIYGLTSRIRDELSFFGLASSIMLKHMSGATMAKSFSDSIKLFAYQQNDVSIALKDLPLAMRFIGFSDAINFIAKKPLSSNSHKHMPIIKSIAEKSSSGFDAISTVSTTLDSIVSNLESAFSSYNNKNNRDTTLLMLFSTVLPSFALFGIAGYSILSGSASFLPAAFAIFVVVAPISYLIISKVTSAVSNAII